MMCMIWTMNIRGHLWFWLAVILSICSTIFKIMSLHSSAKLLSPWAGKWPWCNYVRSDCLHWLNHLIEIISWMYAVILRSFKVGVAKINTVEGAFAISSQWLPKLGILSKWWTLGLHSKGRLKSRHWHKNIRQTCWKCLYNLSLFLSYPFYSQSRLKTQARHRSENYLGSEWERHLDVWRFGQLQKRKIKLIRVNCFLCPLFFKQISTTATCGERRIAVRNCVIAEVSW